MQNPPEAGQPGNARGHCGASLFAGAEPPVACVITVDTNRERCDWCPWSRLVYVVSRARNHPPFLSRSLRLWATLIELVSQHYTIITDTEVDHSRREDAIPYLPHSHGNVHFHRGGTWSCPEPDDG
jgi:hypothetical protein